MKITIPVDSVASTSNMSFTVGPVTMNYYTITAERLAQVWNRPLGEIKLRISRMGDRPSEKEMRKFDRWLSEAGFTPAAKANISTTGDSQP